ncbi:MAG: hypothetical protein ACRBK7_17810 [Acidimicrobiales bacterium]
MDRETEIQAAIVAALAAIDGDRTPLELVGEIPAIEDATEALIADRIEAARAQGLSWEAIAQRLGISRQAAHKRFGKTDKPKKGQRKSRGVSIELNLQRTKRDR